MRGPFAYRTSVAQCYKSSPALPNTKQEELPMRQTIRAFLTALFIGFIAGFAAPAVLAETMQQPAMHTQFTAEATLKATPIAFKTLEMSRMPSAVQPVCNAPKISCESFCFQCRGGRGSCMRDCANRGNPCVNKC